MAKWTVIPKTINNSIASQIDYNDNPNDTTWQIYQDEKPYLEQAKMDREQTKNRNTHFKKFATIPDIVAIEINHKYGLDVHDQTFMSDKDKLAKLMTIIRQEYPYLLSS